MSVGVESLKAVLGAANEVALEVIKVVKKGGGPIAEAGALWSDLQNSPDLRAKLEAARVVLGQVPAEISDLSFSEGIEVAFSMAMYIPRYVEVLKG